MVVVGYGHRAPGMLGLLLEMPDVNIVGVSDLYEDRLQAAVDACVKAGRPAPAASTDYGSLLEIKNLDAVFTPSSWTSHGNVCLDAMRAGAYAATEVGGATSLKQCWDLVETSERTGKPFMLLENCCYGREEMAILNLVKQGYFGELVHAEGGYRHDLRSEVGNGRDIRHYRLDNYLNRNGDVYPTHDLGPISKYLGLNRGNRMVSLVSVASKSCGLEDWVKKNRPDDAELKDRDFALGDVVVTTIKCAHGETITLFHDTSLPRPYSRGNLLQGTGGIWSEDKYAVSIDGISPKGSGWDPHSWLNMKEVFPKFEHPLWKRFQDAGVKGGHGGMDYLVLRAFVEAVKNGTQTPIDVYDSASWMAITCLSEDSVAMGGHPVAVPDFTNGRWINRNDIVEGTYCLDKICKPAKNL
mgnify:CR=1 FL=1